MTLGCVKLLALLLVLNHVLCRFVDVGSPVLDCVRIRNDKSRKLVFGTGYFHTDDNQRYVGVWDLKGTPYNSAFKIERITKYPEPLYFIKMINTQEYLMGGSFLTTSKTRIPILTYHKYVNTSRDHDGVFGFEKAKDERGAYNNAYYIKNVHYDYYVIGSKFQSDPPKGGTNFRLLQMDRKYQPTLTREHQFWIEQCS
uniref:Putative conserved secreted protein n=2 Tax=Culex tarsalis TaxID=7177 RepID=A0A1Q3G023_CULTA